MPVKMLSNVLENEQYSSLVQRLAEEIREPQDKDPEPIIIRDTGWTGGKRLYVIWSQWAGVDPRVRGDLILEAYTRATDEGMTKNLSVVLGLTPNEAEKMGLHYH
jgi:hypothetical protein